MDGSRSRRWRRQTYLDRSGVGFACEGSADMLALSISTTWKMKVCSAVGSTEAEAAGGLRGGLRLGVERVVMNEDRVRATWFKYELRR